REQRAHRKAAAEPLGEGDRIRTDLRRLVSEPAPQAADARLHLVDEEQGARGVAERAQRWQEARWRGGDTALALHRLDDDGGHVGPERGFDRRPVAIR